MQCCFTPIRHPGYEQAVAQRISSLHAPPGRPLQIRFELHCVPSSILVTLASTRDSVLKRMCALARG